MRFNLKRPCKNCPFRNDGQAIPLKAERVRQIVRDVIEHGQTFACHKTTHGQTYKESHCAGAIILQENTVGPGHMLRIAERLGLYNKADVEFDAPVFETTGDMLRWYEENGIP